MATMAAKFAGRCSECGGKIRAGDRIDWSKANGARHLRCASGETESAKVEPGPIKLSGGSGYGCEGWRVGEIILSGEKRRREGGPDALVIVTASKRYVRDDGMSFGVGEDQGYIYSATARPATAEEIAPAIDGAHAAAIAMERDLEMKRIEALFAAAPWLPEEEANRLAGSDHETVVVKPGVHGGRTWAVIEPESIALVCGGYYDDYRRSAQRLPRTAELERRIRALRAE